MCTENNENYTVKSGEWVKILKGMSIFADHRIGIFVKGELVVLKRTKVGCRVSVSHRSYHCHFLCLSKDTVKWSGNFQCQKSTGTTSFASKVAQTLNFTSRVGFIEK